MTTEEIEVTTEQIESEEITFCDSCGADERNSELLTLTKNPEAVVETEDRYGHKRVGTARPDGSTASRLTDFELGRLDLEHEGTIDACEECLREHFNEEVVTPLFELEPRETASQERETDERPPVLRAHLYLLKLAILYLLFPFNMTMIADMNGSLGETGDPFRDGVDYVFAFSQLFLWMVVLVIVL